MPQRVPTYDLEVPKLGTMTLSLPNAEAARISTYTTNAAGQTISRPVTLRGIEMVGGIWLCNRDGEGWITDPEKFKGFRLMPPFERTNRTYTKADAPVPEATQRIAMGFILQAMHNWAAAHPRELAEANLLWCEDQRQRAKEAHTKAYAAERAALEAHDRATDAWNAARRALYSFDAPDSIPKPFVIPSDYQDGHCCACNKRFADPNPANVWWLELIHGGAGVAKPGTLTDEDRADPGYMGCVRIGANCLEKMPELKAFAFRMTIPGDDDDPEVHNHICVDCNSSSWSSRSRPGFEAIDLCSTCHFKRQEAAAVALSKEGEGRSVLFFDGDEWQTATAFPPAHRNPAAWAMYERGQRVASHNPALVSRA